MGYHPTYLEKFLKTQNFILCGDGPLPFDYRHYIAIMAAGRHQCSYLINIYKAEFLTHGGNKEWLKGLQYAPKKLCNLYEINKILAHRPWLIDCSYIQRLNKSPDCLSLSEIVHAIVLLVHVHSLCSFVYSCYLNENPYNTDIDKCNNNVLDSLCEPEKSHSSKGCSRLGWRRPKDKKKAPVDDSDVKLDTLMERMKNLPKNVNMGSEEDRVKCFEHIGVQSIELCTNSPAKTKLSDDISQFVEDPDFRYDDSAKRTKSGLIHFKIQDYSWEDHGYSLVNRLYNDVGSFLDDKFKTTYNLTYCTMGGVKDVDTSRFRRAIWNYIQCVFGIRHDDYNYQEINQLLTRSLKAFIKLACCFPERITKANYDSVMNQLEYSEKVHVNLMILEARMQAELLYGLNAVMKYMT